MKRYLLAMAALLLGANTAQATENDWFFKPYVGADYQYTQYGNKDFGAGIKSDDIADTGLHGGNVHVGARLHENLGVEAGYFMTQEGHKDLGGAKSNLKVKGATFDVLGYYPICPKAELIGTVGASYSKADYEIPTFFSGDDSEWKGRIGAGAQYWLADNINARALVRYQGADFEGSVSNGVVGTLGVNWQF